MKQENRSSAPSYGLIIAAVLFAYLPTFASGFIWDDAGHVTRVDLRPFSGLVRIWTQLGATQQYYPLLHSAFWVEHRLWGDWAAGYHVLNVLLHGLAACLVFQNRAPPQDPRGALCCVGLRPPSGRRRVGGLGVRAEEYVVGCVLSAGHAHLLRLAG